MISNAKYTLLRRRHFVPESGGARTCTLDIFQIVTANGLSGTAARVRYFEEAKTGEVPDSWRNPVVQSLPQDDDLYLNKFIERFAEQKKSTGFVDGESLNRNRPVACRVLDVSTDKSGTMDADKPGSTDLRSHQLERAKSTHPKAKTDIPIEKVAECFNLPIHLAADKLHVGETWLKQKCREHNIKRWPYRKVKSIERSMEKLKASIMATSDPKEQSELKRNLEDLRRHHSNLLFRKHMTPPASPLRASNSNSNPETPRSSMSTALSHFAAVSKDQHVTGVTSPNKPAMILGKRSTVGHSWSTSSEHSPGTTCNLSKHIAVTSDFKPSTPIRAKAEHAQDMMDPSDVDLFAIEDMLGF